jgi:hypothetical protein
VGRVGTKEAASVAVSDRYQTTFLSHTMGGTSPLAGLDNPNDSATDRKFSARTKLPRRGQSGVGANAQSNPGRMQ